MIEDRVTADLAAHVAKRLLSQDEQARLDAYWDRTGLTAPARYLVAAVIMAGQQSPSATTAVSTAEILYATPTWRALLCLAAALDEFIRAELDRNAAPTNALVAESVGSVYAAIAAHLQIGDFPQQHSNHRSHQS